MTAVLVDSKGFKKIQHLRGVDAPPAIRYPVYTQNFDAFDRSAGLSTTILFRRDIQLSPDVWEYNELP